MDILVVDFGATGNNNFGYWIGGSPASLSYQSRVDRVDYSSDTTASVLKGNLPEHIHKSAATGNTTHGYAMGNYPTKTTVYRVDYSNDTASPISRGFLTANAYNSATFSAAEN